MRFTLSLRKQTEVKERSRQITHPEFIMKVFILHKAANPRNRVLLPATMITHQTLEPVSLLDGAESRILKLNLKRKLLSGIQNNCSVAIYVTIYEKYYMNITLDVLELFLF